MWSVCFISLLLDKNGYVLKHNFAPSGLRGQWSEKEKKKIFTF